MTDREKLLEAERLVREVIENVEATSNRRTFIIDGAPVIGRLRYVADTVLDVCKEVT